MHDKEVLRPKYIETIKEKINQLFTENSLFRDHIFHEIETSKTVVAEDECDFNEK